MRTALPGTRCGRWRQRRDKGFHWASLSAQLMQIDPFGMTRKGSFLQHRSRMFHFDVKRGIL